MVFMLVRDFQKKCLNHICPQNMKNGLQNLRLFHRISAIFFWLAKFCYALDKYLLSLHDCDIFFPKRARELNYHDALYYYGALYIGNYDVVVISVLLSLLLSLLLLLLLFVVVKYLLNCLLLLPNYHITNIFIFLYGFLLG